MLPQEKVLKHGSNNEQVREGQKKKRKTANKKNTPNAEQKTNVANNVENIILTVEDIPAVTLKDLGDAVVEVVD